MLSLSVRQVKRLVRCYRDEGAAGFASRHRGKSSNRALSAATRRTVLALVREHYVDFGPTCLQQAGAETTEAYLCTLANYLARHGRPVSFYTDKHSIFRVNHPQREGRLTQFGRALGTLDIQLIHANTPQAKGRVERANGTLQDRLVKELRL